jgi:hypothetical protein
MKDHYRQLALETYGDRCEICGFRGAVEVHHIDYHLHDEWEKKIRHAKKTNAENFEELLEQAKELGFMYFEDNQLGKDNRSTNLAVLCPNCHALVHALDAGTKLLKILPKRK